MALNVKVAWFSLSQPEGGNLPAKPTEIRRFKLDGVASWDEFRTYVKALFPVHQENTNVHFTWTDEDGDHITISSLEELRTATELARDGILRINFITSPVEVITMDTSAPSGSQSKPAPENGSGDVQVFHHGVVCDCCDGSIYGVRYKCIECPDFDLCGACHATGVHSEHSMLQLKKELREIGVQLAQSVLPAAWPHHGIRRHLHHAYKEAHKAQKRLEKERKRRCEGDDDHEHKKKERRGHQGGHHGPHHARRQCMQDFLNAYYAGKPQPTSGGDSKCPNSEEFLKSVGDQVAALLDPLGIDVDVQVEHEGKRTACSGEQETAGQKGPVSGSGPAGAGPSRPAARPSMPIFINPALMEHLAPIAQQAAVAAQRAAEMAMPYAQQAAQAALRYATGTPVTATTCPRAAARPSTAPNCSVMKISDQAAASRSNAVTKTIADVRNAAYQAAIQRTVNNAEKVTDNIEAKSAGSAGATPKVSSETAGSSQAASTPANPISVAQSSSSTSQNKAAADAEVDRMLAETIQKLSTAFTGPLASHLSNFVNATNATTSAAAPVQPPQQATATEEPVVIDITGAEGRSVRSRSSSSSSSSSSEMTHEYDWTYLDVDEGLAGKRDSVSTEPTAALNTTQTDAPVTTETSLYPKLPEDPASAPVVPTGNPIDDALALMLSMGFTNEGGWLRQLLEMKNGDISSVLDMLQPVKIVE